LYNSIKKKSFWKDIRIREEEKKKTRQMATKSKSSLR
jgi:hypothetical protein